MTMKKKLAIILCSMPLAAAPLAFAQTGGSTEGTTSPQSGTQTDMGEDGASNNGGKNNSSSSGSASGGTSSGSSAASTGSTGGDGSNNNSSGASGTSGASGASGTSGTGGASGTSGTSGTSGASGTSGTSGASNTGAASGNSSSTTGSTSSTTGAAGNTSASASSGESFEANLKGKSVYNENDDKIGDVKDVVLDSNGKITHVVLGVGGFVGVGQHDVAIPFNEINSTGDRVTLSGHTKEQLKEMPAYEAPKEERATAPASSSPAPMGAPR